MAKQKNKQNIEKDNERIVMSGLSIIMFETLFIYFLWSVINNKFLINFSIDAVVGVLSFVLLVRNLKIKYEVIKKYTDSNIFKILDILGFLICISLKVILKLPFDFSLPILLVFYYATKKNFQNIIN